MTIRPDPARVGDVELLALVLGGRGLGAAAGLLERFGGLARLAAAEPAELASVPGVGRASALRVAAALRLGRRSLRTGEPPRVLDSAWAAHALLGPGLLGLAVEELHAAYLDRRRRVLDLRSLTRGSEQFTVVDPRQIFRPAVALGAAGVVLAHNHPSGDPSPSVQDLEVTRRVAAAGRTLGIELVDHLVVAREGWVSLRETGQLDPGVPMAASWTAEPRGADGAVRC
ncbi:MAG: DNA repair protein RadC [Alphaproteobacteria bacterium]|nr:DNA repair protein RadC [Alphaproteobacteria bacterium]